MATTHPRINITLEQSTAGILNQFAKREHKSISRLAKELILEALERREDQELSSITDVRDVPKAKRIKHNDAWK